MSQSVFIFDRESTEPERLDKYLAEQLPDYSRSRLQGLIREGLVTVNGEAVTKTGLLLEKPCRIIISIPQPVSTDLKAEDIPLDIVYENEDVLIINKPAGMVVHPSLGHGAGTLVNAVLGYAPEIEGIGGENRPGVVHRLDKDTSGLILVAKNDRSQRWLQERFSTREVQKTYLALVDGRPPTVKGKIDAPIGRDPAHRQKMAITSPQKGRAAVTEYSTLETFYEHTLLEVHPKTGRTHQIRVHLAFLGCPITGDLVYGRKKATILIPRFFLHAARLELVLPGETQRRAFQAALPQELEKVLVDLRSSAPWKEKGKSS